MALKKFATLLLEVFVVLPIVLEARFYHGQDSYKQYYDNRVNGVQNKYPVSEEPNYDRSNVKGKIKSRFEEYNTFDDSRSAESSFIFPDDQLLRRNGYGHGYVETVQGQASNCGDDLIQNWCEHTLNYPADFVNQALTRNSTLYAYAFEDAVDIESRLDTDEIKLCLSEKQDITPKKAKNIKGEWMYVVQSDESNFRQRIRIEKCLDENTKCKVIDDSVPAGQITKCKQKYIYRQLLAINEKDATQEIVRENFPLPASCCCHLERDPDLEQYL